ncbi:fimbrial biogenesis outer membrane usher protein [Sinimarinibacterium sp. CAU 1509]|uniref:fimbria/pilus outer membrane usher protein n=1 Tax=Sinimarinibacterium sp. CAU 1509 TaxID=2562283 RepID=UPI0010ACF20E|nr:fimbria/pilus outer membrane usher protein [Sinimarinibacterium sp. CAU 1509]TJY62866.1 fimbrial biogenesis outer membrane usher protein [Sinimarinibacterium sp. CAU 1509]
MSAIAGAAPGADAEQCDTPLPPAPAQPQPVLLHVVRHPQDRGFDTIFLQLPNGHLAADSDALKQIGIDARPPESTRVEGHYYDLDRFDGVDYALNPCTQTLTVNAAALRSIHVISLRPEPEPESSAVTLPRSGYARFDLVYAHTAGSDAISGFMDLGLTLQQGQLTSGLLYNDDEAIRLDTAWTLPVPDTLTTLRLGDSITRGGLLGSARRLSGIQWGSDFSLQPTLVTFPQPSAKGMALIPSSVDVYVNDVLRSRNQVDAGPFQLNDIPVFTGDGTVRLVVTDLLGRSQVLEYAFYATPQLLNAGLTDFSFAAGFSRLNYGTRSNDYGPGSVSTLFRHGFSDQITLETQFESGDQSMYAATGITSQLGTLGVLQLGIAGAGGDANGGQLNARFERIDPSWSLRAQWLSGGQHFVRIGETTPSSIRRSLVELSWNRPNWGSIAASWLENLDGNGSRINGVTLSVTPHSLFDIFVTAGVRYDLNDEHQHSAYLLMSYAWGGQTNLNASAQHDSGGNTYTASASHRSRGPLGWQTRATRSAGEFQRTTLGSAYVDPRAVISAELDDVDTGTAYRAGIQTEFAMLDQDWFWTRPLSGPFAVVDTGAVSNVRVFNENHLVGSTDESGLLLVPGLRPYQFNRLSVADDDFTIERRIDGIRREVMAPGFGGIRVPFVSEETAARRLRLELDEQQPVPPGADIVVRETGEATFAGFNGETLLSGPQADYTLDVRWKDGLCRAQVRLNAHDRLGDPLQPVRCVSLDSLQDESP